MLGGMKSVQLQFQWLVFLSLLGLFGFHTAALAQNDLDEAQHYGPMAVVSKHEAAQNPDITGRTLLDGDATARWGALKTIGVEEEPLHTMWIDLRRSHQDASDIDIAGMEFSRGVPLDLHAEGSSRMKLLTVGFDGLADEPLKPLWIDAIYMQEGGEWFRIATIACRCNITMTNSEIFSHRRTTLGSGDLLYLVSFPGNTEIKGHLEIVRLRARQNRFTAVMHYETNNWSAQKIAHPIRYARQSGKTLSSRK